MAEAKDCPKCRLVNPPSAQRCDCGYDFASRRVEQSYFAPGTPTRADPAARVVGAGCFVVALVLLLAGFVRAGAIMGAGGGMIETGLTIGAVLAGFAALGLAVYLLRRPGSGTPR